MLPTPSLAQNDMFAVSRRSQKHYIAPKWRLESWGDWERRGEGQSRSQWRFNSFRRETEKPKATTNAAAAAAAFPLCNDSDSWKTNLAIKEGEKRERERERQRGQEKSERGRNRIGFPHFLPFWRQKRAGRSRSRCDEGRADKPKMVIFDFFEKVFSSLPRQLPPTRTHAHARFSPFPLMNRKFELVRVLGKNASERANYRRDTPRR